MSENLPKGWIEKPLADVTEPRGEKVSPQDYPDLQFIGMDHVESQTTRITGSVPACSMKSNAARFYTNDVLYGRLRPYLNKVTQPLFDGLASAEFIVFPDTDLVKSDYLKYRLNAADFVSFASHLNEGDRPRVGFDQIGTFKIKVPPPKEQKRIVAKIEELFSELDKGIENLKTAREQLKVYRQAVLKHAFEGKLTANWREKNKDKLKTADELLERIKQEPETAYQQQLADCKNSDSKGSKPHHPKTLPPLPAEVLAELPELPKGWVYVRAEEITGFITKGTTPRKELLFDKKGEIPFIKVYNLTKTGFLDFSVNPTFVNRDTHNGFLARSKVYPGDVLMNIVGPPLGKVSIVPSTYPEWNINQAIAIFRGKLVSNKFLAFYLAHEPTVRLMMRKSKATAGQFNLTLEICRETLIPFCSQEEQKEIELLIEAQISEVDQLDQNIIAALQKSEALRQSILKRAFSGRLVAQDPKDEPASVLLERIKAEKNESPKRKKKVA